MKRFLRWLPLAVVVAAVLACVGAWLVLLWFNSTHDQPYVWVEDGLYIGGAVDRPPRGTRAVVNLCGRPDSFEVEAALWEPVFESGKEPTLSWLRRVVGFIAEQRRQGRTTFVHCLAGMNRSGAVVTAYLMQEHSWGRDEALAFLQARRPEVQPNPTLMRLLTEWEQARKTETGAAAAPGSR
jgi:hypothetical protein